MMAETLDWLPDIPFQTMLLPLVVKFGNAQRSAHL